MNIAYKKHRFHSASLRKIDQANTILAEYSKDGYTLTLRQLYYQFVARNLIPNNDKEYDRLGVLISNARYTGRISWEAIEDRNRVCHIPVIKENRDSVLGGIEYGYCPDLWRGQENYIEVWVEKDALINVVERPADEYSIAHMACRGYMSSSEAWRAARRFHQQHKKGKKCHLLHLGDHDPSGIDMTRDNNNRFKVFRSPVEVHRIALNMGQVEEFQPPPNPAKVSDTRFNEYVLEHGATCWELDALPPQVISDLIREEVRQLLDEEKFNAAVEDRDRVRAEIAWLGENSESVFKFAKLGQEGEGAQQQLDELEEEKGHLQLQISEEIEENLQLGSYLKQECPEDYSI